VNLGQARVAIRERPLAEIVDLSFRFVVGLERRAYLKLAVFWLLPAFSACAALRLTDASWWWVWCAAIALNSLVQAPFTIAAGRAMFERGVTLKSVSRETLSRLPRYFMATVLRVALLSLGALTVFGLVIGVPRLLFLNEIVLLERLPVGAAMGRSSRFLGTRTSVAFEAAVALALVPIAFALVADALGRALVETLFEIATLPSLLDEQGSYFALFGFFVATPFCAALRYLAYIDVRTRREAWDVQVRFQRASLELARGLS
jgi:hypothetical protein